MCCSIRAAVFFLASVHIFFSVTQLVYILPVAVASGLEEKIAESTMAFIYCILFFATGFMTFRGADEESATLVRLGAFCLAIVIILRFILLSFSLMLVDKLPEASFLYVYGTSVIPVMFTVILYLIYLAILFCYYKELKYENLSSTTTAASADHQTGGFSRTISTRESRRVRNNRNAQLLISFQSPTPVLRSHILSNSHSAGMLSIHRTHSATVLSSTTP